LREWPAGRKKIIVVISPAGCGSNVRPSEEARERLTHDQIQIYGVNLGECFTIPPSDPRAQLRQYSDPTGGEVYRVASESRQLQTAFARIIEQARHQYVLSYDSSNPHPAQSPLVRKIEVKVNRPHVKVTYRKQYLQYPDIR
jgi:hypothetical protein